MIWFIIAAVIAVGVGIAVTWGDDDAIVGLGFGFITFLLVGIVALIVNVAIALTPAGHDVTTTKTLAPIPGFPAQTYVWQGFNISTDVYNYYYVDKNGGHLDSVDTGNYTTKVATTTDRPRLEIKYHKQDRFWSVFGEQLDSYQYILYVPQGGLQTVQGVK